MNTESVDDIYELSPAQQGMLFHSLYARTPDLFLEQLTCELRGALDADALAAAWDEVVRRHAALRLSFHVDDLDKPLQVVHREATPIWERHDWRARGATEQARQLEAFLAGDRARGFVLDAPPLMRLALLQLADDRHVMVWTHHHLLMDGWSLPIVLGEVFALYDGLVRGAPVHLPPRRSFGDFIGFLQGEAAPELPVFWRDYLAGLDGALPVTGGAAASALDLGHRDRSLLLPADATAALAGLVRTRGVTLGTLLQGAWAIVLAKLAGRDDVVFGATVSGRPAALAEADTIVGPFINTLPVRLRVPAAGGVFDWLRADAERRAGWRASEHASVAQIVEWAGLPAGRPVFDSVLVFGNYPIERGVAHGGLVIDHARVDGGRTTFPLVVMADPGPQLALRLVYDAGICDDALAQRIVERLRDVLAAIAASPDQPIGALVRDDGALRAQLVALGEGRRARPRASYVAPRNDLEEEIAQVWAELLEVPQVGVEDDYFELGGHSLLAARILARLRERFGVELPLQVLFARRLTVAGLAETVAEHLIADASSDELSRAMAELEGMSDDEVRRLLAAEVA